jgi:hypothetical protein
MIPQPIKSSRESWEARFTKPYEIHSQVFSYNLEVGPYFLGSGFTGYGLFSHDETMFATSQFVIEKERELRTHPIIFRLMVLKQLTMVDYERIGLLIPARIEGNEIIYEIAGQGDISLRVNWANPDLEWELLE